MRLSPAVVLDKLNRERRKIESGMLERAESGLHEVLSQTTRVARRLEDVMSAYYDGQYDVLLSTSIVESGDPGRTAG